MENVKKRFAVPKTKQPKLRQQLFAGGQFVTCVVSFCEPVYEIRLSAQCTGTGNYFMGSRSLPQAGVLIPMNVKKFKLRVGKKRLCNDRAEE